MAEGKKGFVLYADIIHTVKKLSKEDQAELFVHILEYVNDLNPKTDNMIVDLVFEPIKQQLKRDLEKYRKRAERARENGQRGGRPKEENNPENPVGYLETQSVAKKPKKPDTVKDNVTVNVKDKVTVKDNVILLEKETKYKFNFKQKLIDYGFHLNLIEDWLKVRKDKKASNTETALNKFIYQVELSGKDKNEILKICVEKSWKGFESAWLKNLNENYGKSNIGGSIKSSSGDPRLIGRQNYD